MSFDECESSSSAPFVSVIVPLHNEARRIAALLGALQSQSYLNYEVILVDNDSTDGTAAIATKYLGKMTRLVSEPRVRNPDVARNTGIAVARGSLLVFTDGDCLPGRAWLEELVKCLFLKNADLVAGRIDFDLPTRPDAAQVYDAISFLQHADSVANRGVAFTSNLLVTRRVMDALGGFVNEGGWNGDSVFTRGATGRGFRLVYADAAPIRHPVRSWRGLVPKVWRIAFSKGYCANSSSHPSQSESALSFFFQPKPHLRHLNPYLLALTLKRRFGKAPPLRVISVMALAWAMALTGAVGFVMGRGLRRI